MAGKRGARMTLADVGALATSLPDVEVTTKWNHKTWAIGGRGFVWHRPLGKADIKRYGDKPLPQGEIVAVRVENLDAKDALLAMELPGFFTIEHFNGYAAVLIELDAARTRDVKAAVEGAWRAMAALGAAPKRKPRKKR